MNYFLYDFLFPKKISHFFFFFITVIFTTRLLPNTFIFSFQSALPEPVHPFYNLYCDHLDRANLVRYLYEEHLLYPHYPYHHHYYPQRSFCVHHFRYRDHYYHHHRHNHFFMFVLFTLFLNSFPLDSVVRANVKLTVFYLGNKKPQPNFLYRRRRLGVLYFCLFIQHTHTTFLLEQWLSGCSIVQNAKLR